MRYLLMLCLLCVYVIDAKTICLNMIVKNESQIIERCLNSLKDEVDYWVIVDTGSTDDTQQIIRKCMQGRPGELIEKPWVNFGHNRNEALELARNKADYILFIDADEALKFTDSFDKSTLKDPYYYGEMQEPNGVINRRMLLIDAKFPWKWVGAIHESIYCEGIALDFNKVVKGVSLINYQDGCRSSDPDKYLKDAGVLEIEVQKDPTNSRHVFYLAQCYLNSGQKLLALKNYERRVQMEGSADEKWYSLYTIARLHDEMNFPSDVVTKEYCLAFQLRPWRAEPLTLLALHHLKQGNFIIAYALAVQALSLKLPKDSYFVEGWIYQYGTACIYADAARYVGLKEQALQAYDQILKYDQLPESIRLQVEKAYKEMVPPGE